MAHVNNIFFLIHPVSGSLWDVFIAHVHIVMTLKIRFIGQP